MANENGDSVNNFLLGALVGGILGVLFAPQEGRKTREFLKLISEETLKDLQDSTEKSALKARILSEDAAGKLQKTASDVRGKVEHFVEETIGDKPKVKRVIKRGRRKIQK